MVALGVVVVLAACSSGSNSDPTTAPDSLGPNGSVPAASLGDVVAVDDSLVTAVESKLRGLGGELDFETRSRYEKSGRCLMATEDDAAVNDFIDKYPDDKFWIGPTRLSYVDDIWSVTCSFKSSALHISTLIPESQAQCDLTKGGTPYTFQRTTSDGNDYAGIELCHLGVLVRLQSERSADYDAMLPTFSAALPSLLRGLVDITADDMAAFVPN